VLDPARQIRAARLAVTVPIQVLNRASSGDTMLRFSELGMVSPELRGVPGITMALMYGWLSGRANPCRHLLIRSMLVDTSITWSRAVCGLAACRERASGKGLLS
jgi:hypothetical protein